MQRAHSIKGGRGGEGGRATLLGVAESTALQTPTQQPCKDEGGREGGREGWRGGGVEGWRGEERAFLTLLSETRGIPEMKRSIDESFIFIYYHLINWRTEQEQM